MLNQSEKNSEFSGQLDSIKEDAIYNAVHDIMVSVKNKSDNEDHNKTQLLKYRNFNTIFDGKENDMEFYQSLKKLEEVCKKELNPLKMGNNLTSKACQDLIISAEKHRDANRLCVYDLMGKDKIVCLKKDKQLYERIKCICGCNKMIGEPLPTDIDQKKLRFLGNGIMLYFFFIRMLILMIGIGIVIFAIYTLVYYLTGNMAVISNCATIYCSFKEQASLQNQGDLNGATISLWLGFTMCILWIVILRVAKCHAIFIDEELDKNLDTPSDLAIKIENLPYGCTDEVEIKQMLEQRWEKCEFKQHEAKPDLKIKSIQIVYNMSTVRQLIKKIQMLSITVFEKLKKTGEVGRIRKSANQTEYKVEKQQLIEAIELLGDLKKKFYAELPYRRKLATTYCVVQFKDQEMKDGFLRKFGSKHKTVVDYIRQVLKEAFSCLVAATDANFGRTVYFKGKVLKIERAPQPQDIQWQNCEVEFSWARLLMIYFISGLIILISFGVLIGLNYIQSILAKDPANNPNTLSIINYIISFSLMLINQILSVTLLILVKYQYNHTLSEELISQVNKTITTQALNSIIVPLITNAAFQGKLYGSDGASGTAFDFSISNTFVFIALVLFDPVYLLKKFILYVRCLRIQIVKYLAQQSTVNSQTVYIKQVNDFYTNPDIDMCNSYIYLTGVVLHTSFYCALEPTIMIIAFIGLIAFYYIKKNLLVNRYCYPKMLQKHVFDSILVFISAAPIFYGVGVLVFTTIAFKGHVNVIVPCILSIAFAVFNLINPKGIFDRLTKYLYINYKKWMIRRSLKIAQKQSKPQAQTQEQQIQLQQDVFTYNVQYHQKNNIGTLFGHRRLIKGLDINQSVKNEILSFVQSFGSYEQDPFQYPMQNQNSQIVIKPQKNRRLRSLPPLIKQPSSIGYQIQQTKQSPIVKVTPKQTKQ